MRNKEAATLFTHVAGISYALTIERARPNGDATVRPRLLRYGDTSAVAGVEYITSVPHVDALRRPPEQAFCGGAIMTTTRNLRSLTFPLALLAGLAFAGLAWSDVPPGVLYTLHNLVSDGAVPAAHIDPHLKNGWGVAFNPNGFQWVANNNSGTATLYDGNGVPQSLVVTIPGQGGAQGTPTGIVFSGSNDFMVTQGGVSGPSRFIFATEDGTISAWAPNVDPTHAILTVDSSASNAVYKGLALAANGTGNFLYAADFRNGKVAVFDNMFHPATLPGNFSDPHLPPGFAPFGIQNLNGNLYVSYAKQNAERHDDVAGPGLGFVNVFNANGQLIRRVASRGPLNAPWGMALAPADFGIFSNSLLVGNFGDGRISAFDLPTGNFLGQMRGPDRKRLVIDGLWGIDFGNGILDQPTSVLFFAAGPNGESDGLYGRIEPSNNGLFDFSEDDD